MSEPVIITINEPTSPEAVSLLRLFRDNGYTVSYTHCPQCGQRRVNGVAYCGCRPAQSGVGR
jgi:recombinational DNA repair protein (RecF pathway)